MFNPDKMIANIVEKKLIKQGFTVIARFLLAYIFIVAGFGKIIGYTVTAGYMQSMGVPSTLLPLVILLELGGGLALLFGFQTRTIALFLGVFSIVSALMFHGSADDVNAFRKNLAIAGGLFFITIYGGGVACLDALFGKKPN